ncbi:hypothetical protein QJQ45_008704 [Haematococcus lacustris]|nr:hypothetical protein QJQ45_008704 [Haematococcus lacustris]
MWRPKLDQATPDGWTETATQLSTSSGQGRPHNAQWSSAGGQAEQGAPALGREYLHQSYKKLRDQAPKALAQQPVSQ